ncbi:hypothetical protein D3C84_353040 [compost metagenome]
MQDRQALGHHCAEVFQLLGAQLVLPGVEQQGDGHVEALQGLDDGAGQQREQDELPRAGRRPHIDIAFQLEQALVDEGRQPLVDHLVQLAGVPADEEFRLQVGVERAGVAQDLLAAHACAALEEAGEQRWQGEDVQYVVAVVGHEDGILLVQVKDLAQGVLLLGQQTHALHVLDQRLAIAFGQGRMGRVGHGAEEGQIEIEHPDQGALVQRQAAGGQQRQGHQVDRVDGRGVVEVAGDAHSEPAGGVVEPGRAVLRAEVLGAPFRLLLVEELGQPDRLAEVHRHRTETQLQRADDLEQVEDGLLLLARPAQLAQVGAAFQHALVADVHRHEDDGQARGAQETAQGDGQHPGLGMQHAPGARTSALDEVLHREAAAEQGVQVFVEHRGVQRVALEGAAHEKCPAAAQQAADHRHVEVDPGGDVRRCQAVAEQQVGQQQVVDMAAVAGHVDDLVALGDFLYALDMVDLDAFVQLVPEPGQHHFEKADGGIGEVRGDLVAVPQGLGLGGGQADLLALGFIGHGLAYLGRAQQSLDQVAAVGKVGADDRGLLVAEVHPQDAVDHAQGAFRALVLGHQFAQVDGRGELHAGLAPEYEDADQLAQAPGHRPAIGEEQLPGAGLAVRRLAPEHRHRDDLRVVQRVLLDGVEHPYQGGRGATLVLAAQPAGLGSQVEEGGRLQQVAHCHRQHRARQARLGAFPVHHRQVTGRRLLQRVEHRLAAVELEGEGGLVDGFRAYPEVEQAAQGAEGEAAERGAGHRTVVL